MSAAEIHGRITKLNDEAYRRLVAYANVVTLGTRLEPRELLGAAIDAALSGRRRCPTDVDLVGFLCMSMKSIASSDAKKAAREQPFPLGGDGEGQGDVTESFRGHDVRAVEAETVSDIDARALLNRAYALLGDDETAQLVLMGRLEDKGPAIIQTELGISEVEYASILKKIKRRLAPLAKRGD